MHRTTQLLGFTVALLLTLGCEGAPSQGSQGFQSRNLLTVPHIIDGKDTNIEEIPYQISIEVLRMHACGGAIVSENYVVTAAHCIDPWTTLFTWFKRIRAGSTTEFPFWWGGSIHQIAEIAYHPQWTIETLDYDIGVIRVSNPFEFSEKVQPILVPPAGENFLDFTRSATASGWGLTKPGGTFTAWRLQSVQIPLVPRQRCIELHNGAGVEGVPEITPRMLCGAGTGKGGPCHGDSGGPLTQKGQLVGLVSWGVRCNDNVLPSVFTNVLNEEVRQFIKENSGV